MITPALARFRRLPVVALFGGDCPALPVDLLRIFVGALSFVYFFTLWREAGDISNPQGLIDHALVQEVFWFTRLGLFQSGIGFMVIQAAYVLAMVASVAVVIGWQPRRFAGILFVIAVSAFRWNFLVAYVEDAIMDLMLFWLLLLPIGSTLTLGEAWHDGRAAWSRWTQARVPGLVVGCFLANLALIYVVAGAWKWTSPMWRDGTALFAVLQLPVARAPEFWSPEHLAWLKIFDWGSLAFEPLFPLALFLRRGHPLKWLLLAAVVGFHGGIVVTMRIPFANLACLGASVVVFREELMAWLTRGPALASLPPTSLRAGWPGRIAVTFIVVLSLAMLRDVPLGAAVEGKRYEAAEYAIDSRGAGGLTALHKPAYAALWSVGIAQEYQLFNWIDARNHRFRYEIMEHEGASVRPIAPTELFPDTNRSVFLQSYLLDHCWFAIPPERLAALKQALALRFAQRYCRRHAVHGTIVVTATVERITAANPHAIERGPAVLFSFTEQAGEVVLQQTPPDWPLRSATFAMSTGAAH